MNITSHQAPRLNSCRLVLGYLDVRGIEELSAAITGLVRSLELSSATVIEVDCGLVLRCEPPIQPQVQ